VDVLWSPWRYEYIRSGEAGEKPISPDCVFCAIQKDPARDEDNFILHRAGHNFIVLNIYPYVSGHLHMHILPRWFGDVNFMTSVGETRTIPEDLRTTYEKLKGKI